MDRKINGIRDEALAVRGVMKRFRLLDIRAIGNRDQGPQSDLHEPAASVPILDHRAFRRIGIGHDFDPGLGRQMQIPEHVASGERGDRG